MIITHVYRQLLRFRFPRENVRALSWQQGREATIFLGHGVCILVSVPRNERHLCGEQHLFPVQYVQSAASSDRCGGCGGGGYVQYMRGDQHRQRCSGTWSTVASRTTLTEQSTGRRAPRCLSRPRRSRCGWTCRDSTACTSAPLHCQQSHRGPHWEPALVPDPVHWRTH